MKLTYEIIYGIHPIEEVLKAKKRKVLKVFTVKNPSSTITKILSLKKPYTQVASTSRDQLEKLAGTHEHQSIVAYVQPYTFRKKPFAPQKQKLLLLIDGIQDVRNLGALLRTAYCTNISGVILPKVKNSPLSGAAFKSSAGLAEHLEIIIGESAHKEAQKLVKSGYTIYAATFGGKEIDHITFKAPACIVIGSEGFGVSKEIERLGIPVTLPQKESHISYNASVAGALSMFYISRALSLV